MVRGSWGRWRSDEWLADVGRADQRPHRHQQRHGGEHRRSEVYEQRRRVLALRHLMAIGDHEAHAFVEPGHPVAVDSLAPRHGPQRQLVPLRSEEHTSELQSLMRISYAVFCLKKKTYTNIDKQ